MHPLLFCTCLTLTIIPRRNTTEPLFAHWLTYFFWNDFLPFVSLPLNAFTVVSKSFSASLWECNTPIGVITPINHVGRICAQPVQLCYIKAQDDENIFSLRQPCLLLSHSHVKYSPSLKSKFPFFLIVMNQWPWYWPQSNDIILGTIWVRLKFNSSNDSIYSSTSSQCTRVKTHNLLFNIGKRGFLVTFLVFLMQVIKHSRLSTFLPCVRNYRAVCIFEVSWYSSWNYIEPTLNSSEVISMHSFWIITFSSTLVELSIGCLRQENEN